MVSWSMWFNRAVYYAMGSRINCSERIAESSACHVILVKEEGAYS